MIRLFCYWPQERPILVGFHKPALRGEPQRSAPSHRASSPLLGQGGKVETLMQGIWTRCVHSPHNQVSTSSVRSAWRPRGPDHPRPVVVPALSLGSNDGAAGLCPLRTRGSRTCLRHLLAPSLGEGGRLTPTTLGARLSSLNLLPRALEEGGYAAFLSLADRCVGQSPKRPSWGISEPSEVGPT